MLYSDELRAEFKELPSTLLHRWLFLGHKPSESLTAEIEQNYSEVEAVNSTVSELRQRLTSRSDSELHTSAVELYFWHLLEVEHGYRVQNHPELTDKTTHPEFAVATGDGDVYVEVRTLFDDADQTNGWKVLGQLKDRIKQELAGVGVRMMVSPERLLDGGFPVGQAARAVAGAARRFVEAGRTRQKLHLDVRGTDIEVDLFKDSDGEPLVDLSHQGMFNVTPDRPIDAIKKKAGRYGNLGKPYVLVLDMPDNI